MAAAACGVSSVSRHLGALKSAWRHRRGGLGVSSRRHRRRASAAASAAHQPRGGGGGGIGLGAARHHGALGVGSWRRTLAAWQRRLIGAAAGHRGVRSRGLIGGIGVSRRLSASHRASRITAASLRPRRQRSARQLGISLNQRHSASRIAQRHLALGGLSVAALIASRRGIMARGVNMAVRHNRGAAARRSARRINSASSLIAQSWRIGIISAAHRSSARLGGAAAK